MEREGNTAAKDGPPPATQDQLKLLSKITSGSEEMRDHDFPVSVVHAKRPSDPIAIDTGAPPPEAVHPGGKPGAGKGDVQQAGVVGTIFDQNLADPTISVDR